jgi:exosortase O
MRVGALNKRLVATLSANAAILVLWLWLYRPVSAYLGIIFTRQEFRTNQIVLLAVLVLIVLQSRRGQFSLALGHLPQLQAPGLALALSASFAYVAAERWLDINTLSAMLFGLATYGLLGLWMQPRRWRQGFPAALLLVGVLPFGEHMETFIGYPLRLITARIASQGLGALGSPNVGVDTILIFESGFSQVDSPCSGVKSLWTGGLFLLAATWIERRPVNRRWLLVAATFVGLLLVANLARVIILVLVGQIAGWRLLAEMLHIPLGVIGFVAACAAAMGLLRWSGDPLAESASGQPAAAPRPRWLAPALAVLLLGLVLLYTPRAQPAAAASFEWEFPEELVVQAWPLTPKEIDWLSAEGSLPVSATRLRFEWRHLHGSLLLIASDTWRAHHHPERCFTVYGLQVLESQLHLVNADFPLRWLTLNKAGDRRPLYSAGYWLQSGQRLTDDYSVRIWDDIAPQPQPWVLVTVLFDNVKDPAETDSSELFVALRQVVQRSLEGKEVER